MSRALTEDRWAQRFREFLAFCTSAYAHPTERIRAARRFQIWFKSQGLSWPQVHEDVYRSYLRTLQQREPPYTPRSLYFLFRCALCLAEYYSHRGYILWVPEARDIMKCPPKSIKVFPPEPEDIEKLFEVLDTETPTGIRDRAILELFYGSGLRLSEMARLRVSDINLSEETILVRIPKNRRERQVPMTKASVQALENYLKCGRPFMLTTKNKTTRALWLAEYGRDLKRATFQSMIARHSRAAGVKISCHDLRHACATHLIRNGAGLLQVSKVLGHVSLSSTRLYTHLRALDLAEMHKRCHPLGGVFEE